MNFRMWLESLWSLPDYKLPNDKEQQLFDFYMMTSLLNPQEEQSKFVVKQMEDTLLQPLRKNILDALFFSIASEFRHFLDNKQNKDKINVVEDELGPKYVKILKKFYHTYAIYDSPIGLIDKPERSKRYKREFSDSRSSYKTAYKSALSTGNKKDFVRLAYLCFDDIFDWTSSYGGSKWKQIANAWLKLNNATNPKDIIVLIDHAYDLQHNTDTVFNKIQSYLKNGSYSWLADALDFKRDIKSPWEIIDKVSPSMKRISARIFKIHGQGTLEDFEKQQKQQNKEKKEKDKYSSLDEFPHPLIGEVPSEDKYDKILQVPGIEKAIKQKLMPTAFKSEYLKPWGTQKPLSMKLVLYPNAKNKILSLLASNQKIEAIKYFRDNLHPINSLIGNIDFNLHPVNSLIGNIDLKPRSIPLFVSKKMVEYIQDQDKINQNQNVDPYKSIVSENKVKQLQSYLDKGAPLIGFSKEEIIAAQNIKANFLHLKGINSFIKPSKYSIVIPPQIKPWAMYLDWGMQVEIPKQTYQQIIALLEEGRKIAAIKIFRTLHPAQKNNVISLNPTQQNNNFISLKASKLAIEWLAKKEGIPLPDPSDINFK
jgi:hypothetical protein